ncbi:IS110 family transposase [Rhodococcus koreensis]|uniref:IS110 family transposase n=1 Tax=Rhodococcus koreensis TaxID=99653 RepID=UPI00197D1E05|nr:IS110 family transposase [Rhodococcus koreensis]QSE84689.1 IS110 family transposase [Rhodococcus koreensis]QSE84724.1 IS110 family transposase [Rhodococcus koreensis]
MSINCGIDWAEVHHDVALVDENGTVIARKRIDTGTAGLTALLEVIAESGGAPGTTPIAIETDKNLLVVALMEAGFTVYPINPRAVARYRERHGQAGGKSDPGDAAILANILRTDRAMHRPMPAISEHGRAIKALARQHQEAIWALHQTISRLRSVLLEFYPAALQAFPNLKHRAAVATLSAAPTPASGRALTRRKVVTVLQRCGRRNDPNLVERILQELKTPALGQPPQVEEALGHAVTGLLAVIASMQQSVDSLEDALGREFDSHPLAPILRSAPGLGPILAARVLAEIGDDPERFATANGLRAFAGTAPITRASGRSHYVKARKVRNKRLGDACHWWAFVTLTKSAGARAHYDKRRAAGDHHNAALRNLANKLLGRMWWCLQHNEPWDDHAAWPDLNSGPKPAAA